MNSLKRIVTVIASLLISVGLMMAMKVSAHANVPVLPQVGDEVYVNGEVHIIQSIAEANDKCFNPNNSLFINKMTYPW